MISEMLSLSQIFYSAGGGGVVVGACGGVGGAFCFLFAVVAV